MVKRKAVMGPATVPEPTGEVREQAVEAEPQGPRTDVPLYGRGTTRMPPGMRAALGADKEPPSAFGEPVPCKGGTLPTLTKFGRVELSEPIRVLIGPHNVLGRIVALEYPNPEGTKGFTATKGVTETSPGSGQYVIETLYMCRPDSHAKGDCAFLASELQVI
jgi:hypothetical protein